VWADVWNIKFIADYLKAEFAIKVCGSGAGIAPEKFGGIFFGEGDAREGEGAAEAGAASFGCDGHAAKLERGELRRLGHFSEVEGSDAEELAVAESAEVAGGGCVIAGEMGGGYWAAGAEDGVTKRKGLGGGDGEDGEQGRNQ